MLEQKITDDMRASMKAREELKVSTLRLLIAALKNLKIDKHVETLEDADVLAVIKKQVKQRQDSIEQYTKADRADLADKEKSELSILQGYLPQELSEDAVKTIVQEVITELNASSMKDMGTVMKAVGEKTNGAADNKIVSQFVKAALSS